MDMRRIALALIATSAFGAMLAGSANVASAHYHRRGCAACGPVAPTTLYKTVHPNKYETRYHDVSVTRHVTRVHRITTVTRVQPIIHIHEVTRVHHHTAVRVVASYHRATQYLQPIRYVRHSTENFYEGCGCRP